MSILVLPFLACLILTGIYVYLGIHIVHRGIIFVDLALAQVAALGATTALLIGYELSDPIAYVLSLAFTIFGAVIFSSTRQRRERIPQEATIGIVYVVSAAASILVLDRAPGGAEHIRSLLVGDILTVTPDDLLETGSLCVLIGAFHWMLRKSFLMITFNAEDARGRGQSIFLWDFLFYFSFGLVVAASVRLAGVLLLFAFLVVPAVVSLLFSEDIGKRLAAGWAVGGASSAAGLLASYRFDLPTGAAIVCAFGLILVLFVGMKQVLRLHAKSSDI